jgi:hypothetical protein
MKRDETIFKELKRRFGDEILDAPEWPDAYPSAIKFPKAILLGCDPSNQHDTKLPFVFAHGSENPIFNSLKSYWKSNLAAIGLSEEEVYWQNLCKNYFRKETSKNKRIWKEATTEVWIPKIKEELDQFNRDVPVLLSAEILLHVLKTKRKAYKAAALYQLEIETPIPPEENKLGRPLFPFYRGGPGRMYHMENQARYRAHLKTFLSH